MLEFGKLKAVIWDMDGVIVDSESSHFKSWQIVFNERGIRVNEDKLRETFGMTTPQVIREVAGGGLNEQTVIEIGVEKERIFRRMIGSEIEYLPGAEYWLKTFYEYGIRQALASSGSQKNIDTVLDALDARAFFDEVVSGLEKPSKPAPDVFLSAAEKLDVSPANCLVLEDAIAGVRAARAAGMKCIAVTTTNPAQKLDQAHIVLENLRELDAEMIAGLFQPD